MPQNKSTQAVSLTPVWSLRLRWAHWIGALAVLGLIATGWLLRQAPALFQATRDYHLLLAYVLMVGLGLRFWLLFAGRTAEHWRDLIPRPMQWQAVTATLRFYLSLGHASLPRWYAHNPLWGPLYVLFFLLLMLQIVTGCVWLWGQVEAGSAVIVIHRAVATAVAMFTLLHILAVVLHDARGDSADISGMLNGKRLFHMPPRPSMEDIDRNSKSWGQRP